MKQNANDNWAITGANWAERRATSLPAQVALYIQQEGNDKLALCPLAITGANWAERQAISWPTWAASHNGSKLSRKASDKLARSAAHHDGGKLSRKANDKLAHLGRAP